MQDKSVLAEMEFRNSLNRLTLDTLRVLCYAEGLSSLGSKKKLVERFASRTLSKIKGKVVEINNVGYLNEELDSQVEESFRAENRNNLDKKKLTEEKRYMLLERSLEKSLQAILLKALEKLKQNLNGIGNQDEDRLWPEVKMNRLRDQFEYDKW
ncbi:23099_t:CDS:2 [Cetraspora pellucida]|uniref:23099_t:CDS:1 n=1 Tax=Cetraspora pellucida TaxID=1433469 RepID=A0A9N9AME2_9GLOM|nr:23099_t:CDS:2 [Cetraspora pellucida]